MDRTPATTDETDRMLVRRYLDGEVDAAWALVDHYQRPLYTVALRMLGNEQDAEDVMQTVFSKAFRELASYDPTYRFFSWIYRMTVNESLNALRSRKQMVTLEEQMAIPAPGTSADNALEIEEQVTKALQQLKPDDRAVLVLRHFRSLSYDEISDVLGVPAKTVKSRLFSARERMRLLLLAQES